MRLARNQSLLDKKIFDSKFFNLKIFLNDSRRQNFLIIVEFFSAGANGAEVWIICRAGDVGEFFAVLAQETFEQEQIPRIAFDVREAAKTSDGAERNNFPLDEQIQRGVDTGNIKTYPRISDEKIFFNANHFFVSQMHGGIAVIMMRLLYFVNSAEKNFSKMASRSSCGLSSGLSANVADKS